MNFENVLKIVMGFVTYGIPVLSFLWQIKSDFTDKKQMESIVSNYNYQNITYLEIKNGFIQFFKYPTILSNFSMLISLFVAFIVLFLLFFFSLKTLFKRLCSLILVYDSKIQTKLVNVLSSIRIVVAPILIIVVKMVFK